MQKTILTFIIFQLLLVVLYSHGDHNKKNEHAKPDTLTIVGNDTIAINGIPTEKYLSMKAMEKSEKENEVEEESEEKQISVSAIFEHVHNKVIHFPIALSIIGFLLMLIGYKNNNYLSAIKIIIPFAALISIIAVLSGLNQAEPFEGTSTYSLVETHELLGFGVLGSLVLWSISLYLNKLRKLVWLFAILTITLVSFAGFLGGIIAH